MNIVCKGSLLLGTACQSCVKCQAERGDLADQKELIAVLKDNLALYQSRDSHHLWRGACRHLWIMDPDHMTPCPICTAKSESLLTTAETDVLDMSSELWNAIVHLSDHHPADLAETARDIHNIQNRVMARVARRNLAWKRSVDAKAP